VRPTSRNSGDSRLRALEVQLRACANNAKALEEIMLRAALAVQEEDRGVHPAVVGCWIRTLKVIREDMET